jgi:hypothetical protein
MNKTASNGRKSYMTGYIFEFKGHGCYSPEGKQDNLSQEEVERHNRVVARDEIEAAKESGRALFYLGEYNSVQTWDGSWKSNGVWSFRKSFQFVPNCMTQVTRTDCWFTGPDGKAWWGVNIGDNQVLRARRIKA